jgi:hypothetical protein
MENSTWINSTRRFIKIKLKKMKPTIKQFVINTFSRVGISYLQFDETHDERVIVNNRFGGGSCETTPFIKYLINWVYSTSNDYEVGIRKVNVSDFDIIRYFILEQDSKAYYTCID